MSDNTRGVPRVAKHVRDDLRRQYAPSYDALGGRLGDVRIIRLIDAYERMLYLERKRK